MAGAAWGKWYWSDWRGDPGLRMCSAATRGIWMDMLCLMAEAGGYLLVNDKAPSTQALARSFGATIEEVETALAELEEHGVFSRDRRGVIYSRKMVRGEIKASRARENGKKGGNPNLRKDEGNGASDNPAQTDKPTEPPTPRNQIPDTRITPPTPLPGGEEDGDLFGDQPEPPAKPVDEVKVAFDLWNDTAKRCGLIVAESLNDKRRSAIKARLAEVGLPGWKRALKAVEVAPLCRGLVPGRDGRDPFKAHLDFVLQPSSFAKLLEGFYGDGAPPPRATASAQRAAWSGPSWIEDLARRYDVAALLVRCAWRPEPPAIVTTSPTIRDQLERELGSDLRKRGVQIIVKGATP